MGNEIEQRLNNKAINADTFGYVVQAACLAHDIGNPPFGHAGEEAIQSWFQSNESIFGNKVVAAQREDLLNFEGNAQGFRILTQLENYRLEGGLQLTFAVLGTFTKYPRSSIAQIKSTDQYPGGKKVGFFDAERDYFCEIAKSLGLQRREPGQNYWCRHPLAFLVEAADDICYAIIDIEDGYDLGYLTYGEAKGILDPIAVNARLSPGMEERDQVAKLRAVAIGELVNAVTQVFLANEEGLLKGSFDHDLISLTPYSAQITAAKDLAKRKCIGRIRRRRSKLRARR